MIEQQQQIINSIMIANCNKYFGHQPHSNGNQHHHPHAIATKNGSANNNLVKIMSNSVVSGASNSAVAAMNNKTNGMSSSSSVLGSSSIVGNGGGGVGVSPATSPPHQIVGQQPAIANKMGSRRIFSPHFKIQVLESYRNDTDCKGNQRATARKYGIHRRQIQKWLQCETALRTSVLNGTNSPPAPSSSSSSLSGQKVDSNNNNQKRTLSNGAKASTSSNQSVPTLPSNTATARHSVAAATNTVNATDYATAGRRTEEEAAAANSRVCVGVSGSQKTTRQNSMEFFSPPQTAAPSSSSLIINVDKSHLAKIELMNEAVPIKPEFCSNTAAVAAAPPSHSLNRVEMPSSTAAMLRHHHHHPQDLYQIRGEEDAPHHSLIAASLPPQPSSTLSSFISTIYGPGLLAFPAPRLPPVGPFTFDYPPLHPVTAAMHPYNHHQQTHSAPIDLSMGNAERRHASGELRHSPLIHVDDARVPSRSVSGDEVMSIQSACSSLLSPLEVAAPSTPIDLSCGRKRKTSACPAEPAKPPKLFKPYLLDEEEEEQLKDVIVDDVESTTSTAKEDSFLDQDLTGLRDKHGHRFEYPTIWSAAGGTPQHHQYYPGSSPAYDSYYFGHENLTLYPSPRQYRYESQSSLSPSAASSPQHHPSRPASSLFDSSLSSSEAYGSYHPASSPASSEIRSSPPVFSLDLKLQAVPPGGAWYSLPDHHHHHQHHHNHAQEMRSRVGSVF